MEILLADLNAKVGTKNKTFSRRVGRRVYIRTVMIIVLEQ